MKRPDQYWKWDGNRNTAGGLAWSRKAACASATTWVLVTTTTHCGKWAAARADLGPLSWSSGPVTAAPQGPTSSPNHAASPPALDRPPTTKLPWSTAIVSMSKRGRTMTGADHSHAVPVPAAAGL